jgi:hypothetical protein
MCDKYLQFFLIDILQHKRKHNNRAQTEGDSPAIIANEAKVKSVINSFTIVPLVCWELVLA